MLGSIRGHRLFGQRQLGLRVGPFALAYAAAFAVYPFGDPSYGVWLLAAAVLAIAMLAAIVWVAWTRLPRIAGLAPMLLFLASIAFLREGQGGAASGYAPLALVPVVWASLFGRRRDLLVVIVALGLMIGLPAVIHADAYPSGELRRAALFILIAAICGGVIQSLIRALLRAESDLARARAYEVHDDLVQAFAAATLALDVGDTRTARTAVRGGLRSAQRLAAEMLADASLESPEPGSLRRARGSPTPADGAGRSD